MALQITGGLFGHMLKNIVYKLFVWVCFKMAWKSRHYIVVFHADRTGFFHNNHFCKLLFKKRVDSALL